MQSAHERADIRPVRFGFEALRHGLRHGQAFRTKPSMKLGIRAKLFVGALILIGVAIAAADLYLSRALEAQITERIRDDLLVRAGLVAERAASEVATLDEARTDALAHELGAIAGARVTLVRADGTVAGDSEVSRERLGRLENHAERPEI